MTMFLKSVCRITAASLLVLGLSAARAADYSTETPSSPGAASPQRRPMASDASISTRVEKALRANKVNGITVKSDMGVVTLTGSVPSEDVRQNVARIAAAVEGVKGVETSSLKIKEGS